MLFTSRIRRIGRFAALAAVYALVFNVLLTGALMAAVSPSKANALHELCLNGASAPGDVDSNGKTDGKPLIRCPLCLSGLTALDVPPQPPALAIRIALDIRFEPRPAETLAAPLPTRDHQPRGPPHLS